MNCTFSIVDDFGKPVTSIAPGTYQVEVSTPIMFKLVRPGGVGGRQHRAERLLGLQGLGAVPAHRPGRQPLHDARQRLRRLPDAPAQTFKAGATYTLPGLEPAVGCTRTSFTVATSGTPPSRRARTQRRRAREHAADSPAPGAVQFRGTLGGDAEREGNTDADDQGKARLDSQDRQLQVRDHRPGREGRLQPPENQVGGSRFKPNALTGVKFVGTHSKTITLKAGRWTYFSGHGTVFNFLVTS